MAIPHFSVAIIGRSAGRSAVDAAAYASRTDLEDERLGKMYRYGRKAGDVVFSRIMLPQGSPERLRDRAALWNEAEKAETRVNSRTARRIIVALPHELTQKQQEQLLTDFVRENFTRKGLAVDMNIHAPDPQGDQRNDHAHLIVTTRTVGKDGIGGKAREMDDKATLQAWRDNWEKMVNRQLERYGHAVRISMKSLEEQGIDRMPQIHMGQAATALHRKGVETDRRDQLESIVNDNDARRAVTNDNQQRTVGREFERAAAQPQVQKPQDWTAGMAFARDVIAPPANDNQPGQRLPQPETIDRDMQEAEWQDSVDQAAIAYAEERRQEFLQTQAAARAAFESQREAMTARHAASWGEMGQRHQAETASLFAEAVSGYQSGTMAEAEQAASSGVSFLLGLFTSWAESITRSVSGSSKAQPKRQRGPDKAKDQQTQRQADQLREAHSRELEAAMQEQSREREAYERSRSLMLFQQAGALQSFEQAIGDKSSMREAFEKHTEQVDGYKAYKAEQAERDAGRDSLERDGPSRDGPELG